MFANTSVEVEANTEEEARRLAGDKAQDQWREEYPSLDDCGTICVDEIHVLVGEEWKQLL